MRELALAALLLALLAACAAEEQVTPRATAGGVPTLAATVIPPSGTTVADTPMATSTPRPPDPVMDMVTYRDERANLTLDYPADWFRYEPEELDVAPGEPYTVTFSPWEPGPEDMIENRPPDGEPPRDAERIDLVVRPDAPATLDEAVAQQEQALSAADPAPTITARESWELANAIPAQRWRLTVGNRETHLLLTLIDGRTILLRGQTSGEQFEQVGRTLRPVVVR